LNRQRVYAMLVLVAVFVLGGLTGAGLMRAMSARAAHQWREHGEGPMIVWILDRRLKLSPLQRERVEAIVQAHEPEIMTARRTIAPQIRAIRARQRNEIREVLTPEQRSKFDILAAESDARQRHMLGLP